MKRRTLLVATLLLAVAAAAILATLIGGRGTRRQELPPVTTGMPTPAERAAPVTVTQPPAAGTVAVDAAVEDEKAVVPPNAPVEKASGRPYSPTARLPETGMPMPDPIPPAPPAKVFPPTFAADAFLRSFGSIAFNTPEELNVHERHVIQLLLDPSEIAPAELESKLSEPGAASSARIRIAENVEAILTGPAFEIRPITPEVQAISREEPTEWRWEVEPREEGTHRLFLTINALIPSAGGERRRAVRTFDRTIIVRVTPTSFTPTVLKLIVAATLLALITVLVILMRSPDGTRSSDAETVELAKGESSESGNRTVALSPGDVIGGRYEIIRLLGKGGMGAVYSASDRELEGEQVALKTLLPSSPVSERALRRFRREIQYARRVAHRNVCRIYDLGQHRIDGVSEPLLFVTMELVEGVTLGELIRREGRLTTGEALEIVRQIAAGLDATHDAGVVHRDLKPGNVMLTPGRTRAVIMDFGLARLARGMSDVSVTESGAIVGSPMYMAPEQLEGSEVTPATDIYALGLVMYEMIAGVAPFEGDSAVSLIAKRLHTAPPPPSTRRGDIDPRWDGPILQCLARNPADRFRCAGEVVAALERALSENEKVVPAG